MSLQEKADGIAILLSSSQENSFRSMREDFNAAQESASVAGNEFQKQKKIQHDLEEQIAEAHDRFKSLKETKLNSASEAFSAATSSYKSNLDELKNSLPEDVPLNAFVTTVINNQIASNDDVDEGGVIISPVTSIPDDASISTPLSSTKDSIRNQLIEANGNSELLHDALLKVMNDPNVLYNALDVVIEMQKEATLKAKLEQVLHTFL